MNLREHQRLIKDIDIMGVKEYTFSIDRAFRGWPDPESVTISKNHEYYETPDGKFNGTTKVIKVLGLATQGLIRWAANEEHKAVIEAAGSVFSHWPREGEYVGNTKAFVEEIEKQMGPAKQHQRILTQAGEIGKEIHQACHDFLAKKPVQKPSCIPVETALKAFHEWWESSGFTAIRMEQPVWDVKDGYAGTIDLVAEHPEKGLGVIDFKTSKGVYDDHHLQVAAYLHAGRNFADLKWAEIVRLPKNAEDPGFEVKQLGAMYDRVLTPDRLLDAFRGALAAYRVLVAK